MARKGGSKVTKVYKVSKVFKPKRRKPAFVTSVRPGTHPKGRSLALSVVIRDMLGLAKTTREARVILREGRIKVDGKVVKDPRRGIGFMDVISIPAINKHYRVVYDQMRRLALRETSEPEFKLCRVQNKTMTKKGLQLNLHDGRNILIKEGKYKTGDTLKVALPTQKILDRYPMEKGSIAYVFGGKHAGEMGNIVEILPGTLTREPLVTLKAGDKEFQTSKEYAFVIGTKTPAIKLEGEMSDKGK